jgi:hypothetical protein
MQTNEQIAAKYAKSSVARVSGHGWLDMGCTKSRVRTVTRSQSLSDTREELTPNSGSAARRGKMKETTLTAIGIICLTIVLVALVAGVTYYNVTSYRYLIDNGYEQTSLPGVPGKAWVKRANN